MVVGLLFDVLVLVVVSVDKNNDGDVERGIAVVSQDGAADWRIEREANLCSIIAAKN